MMPIRSLWYDLLSSVSLVLARGPLCGPRTLQLNVSDECNLDCVMCNRSCLDVGGFMSYEKAVAIIDEVYALGLREIYFHGYGEPFLHPRLLDLFDHVRTACPGLRPFVVTNGTRLTDQTVDRLVAARVGVRVSLHAGDAGTWGRINPRARPDTFGRIERGVARLARHAPASIEVLDVIHAGNHGGIDAMVSFARRTGVRRILFRPMRLYDDATGGPMNDHLLLTGDQHRAVVAALAGHRNGTDDRLDIDATPFDMSDYAEHLGRPSSRSFYDDRSCLLGWVFSLILTDGTVLGCLEESFDRPLGNVHDRSFREIWWSDDYQAFRRGKLRLGPDPCDADCSTWCQHLRTNRRLNLLKRLKILSLIADRRSGGHPGAQR